MMNQKLNDCNRCGDQGDLHDTQKTPKYYWVECYGCNVKTEKYDNRIDAENAWNNNKLEENGQ